MTLRNAQRSYVPLTAIDGNAVFVNPQHVIRIETVDENRTRIRTSDGTQVIVKGKIDDVADDLEEGL